MASLVTANKIHHVVDTDHVNTMLRNQPAVSIDVRNAYTLHGLSVFRVTIMFEDGSFFEETFGSYYNIMHILAIIPDLAGLPLTWFGKKMPGNWQEKFNQDETLNEIRKRVRRY